MLVLTGERSPDPTVSTFSFFKEIIGYDDENADAYYLRGNIYLEEGDADKAVSDFDKALKYTDENAKMSVEIAQDLIAADMDADKYLKNMLNDEASSAGDYYYRGYAYFIMEDYDNAISSLKSALKADDEEYARDSLKLEIRAYEQKADFENAYSLIKDYVEKYPDDEEGQKEYTFLESRIQ